MRPLSTSIMFIATVIESNFVIHDTKGSKILTKNMLLNLSKYNSWLFVDLNGHGLKFIHEFLLEVFDECKLQMYRLNIYEIRYGKLIIRSYTDLGIPNKIDVSKIFKQLGTLDDFLSKNLLLSIKSPRLLSCGSISGKLIKSSGHFIPSNNKAISNSEPNESIYEGSYFGGRCELFETGEHLNVWHYDFPSAYGNILLEDMPIKTIKIGPPYDVHRDGLYEVEFSTDSDNRSCALPVRCGGKVNYLKSGSGFYWSEELKTYIRCGGKIKKVLSGYAVTYAGPIFKSIAENLLKEKAAGNVWAKPVLNGIYGRFAMRESVCKTKLALVDDGVYKLPLTCSSYYKKHGKVVIYEIENAKKLGVRGNAALASYVTAKARSRLADAMLAVERLGGSIVYIDTDSIFAVGKLSLNEFGFLNIGKRCFYGIRDFRS